MSEGFAGTSHEATWTTAQVAEFLGLARKTVLNLVSLGELRRDKQGRLNAFTPSEVIAYRERTREKVGSTKKPGVAAPGQDI